jgi:ribosomal protein S18 acetylase RimI-like enzyme
VQIRDAQPGEIDEIGDIRVTAYRADGFLSPQSEYEPTLRALGADGGGHVLVAVADDGRLLGTVMLQTPPAQLATSPAEAEIRALAVRPAARGAGLGRALLAAVMERAARERVRHVLLFTEPEMKIAHRLYEDAGFRRLPDRDWSPQPGHGLLAYGLSLDHATGNERPETADH